MDLSAVTRMSADDVVTGALAGIELGEVLIAPGVEDVQRLQTACEANLSAFQAES